MPDKTDKEWQAWVMDYAKNVDEKLGTLTEEFKLWRDEERKTHDLLDKELVTLTKATALLTEQMKDHNALIRKLLIWTVGLLLVVVGYLLTVGVPWQ